MKGNEEHLETVFTISIKFTIYIYDYPWLKYLSCNIHLKKWLNNLKQNTDSTLKNRYDKHPN